MTFLVASNPLFVKMIQGGKEEIEAYTQRSGLNEYRIVNVIEDLAMLPKETLAGIVDFNLGNEPGTSEPHSKSNLLNKSWRVLGLVAEKFNKDLKGKLPKAIKKQKTSTLEKEDTMSTKTSTKEADKKAKAGKKASKTTKNGKGRTPSLPGDTRLVWKVKENPFREGTHRAIMLDIFKGANGNTIDGFCKNKEYFRQDAMWLLRNEYIKKK